MEILYQDDRVIVCVKPSGVLSSDEPGGMPELLRSALGENASVKSVHRLDRAVGGVMVYARTKRAASDLGKQMESGMFFKEYRAVVHGIPPSESQMLEDLIFRDTFKRKSFLMKDKVPGAQEAVLEYRLLGTREDYALLSVRLHTGRTHQIRCQLAGHALPIVGDRKYGMPDGAEKIALWSYKLSFAHPRTGEKMSFQSELPDTWPWCLFQ